MPIPSNDYDVGQAFKRIEEELIASMMKNMKRHTDWETDEGFQWEMWQALQLQALEKYRKENPEKFKEEFEEINKMIPEAIKSAREHGQMDQEIEILEAIKKGWKPPELDEGLSGAFFRLNDRKLNALIEATTGDFEKAEAAILRKANDNYRKIIFSAQVYANTGAATYEKAVDMATKDFLAAGINCIEYKNGSRHKLDDYCDMALRTAQKRAYLAGEGEKRQEWGIHTVIMNKRGEGQPCPLCLPFVGKIMIDDVYGGGSRKDGPYKLLSEAMAAGLYHPRCRDSHTAYFPDIDEEENLTREEVKKTKEEYMAEEEANYCSRQEEKYGRLAEHSLDPENRRKYAARRDAWGEKAEQLQIEIGAKEEAPQKSVELTQRRKGRLAQRRREQVEAAIGQMNTAQLREYIENNLNTQFVDIEGANIAFVREAVKVISIFEEKMGGGTIDGLSVRFGGLPKEVYAKYDDKTKTVLLKKKGSLEQFEARQRAENLRYRRKWKTDKDYNATETFSGTIWHELGHAVDAESGQALSKSLSADATLDELSVKISAYAGDSQNVRVSRRSEAWAENFAAYMDAGRNKERVPRQIAEKIDGYFETQKTKDVGEAGRLKQMAREAEERERLFDILVRSVTIGHPYIEPEKIKAPEFRAKFSRLTGDSRINDRIRSLAQGNITKNNGTYTEMLDIIDLDTGESVIRKVGERNAMEVALTPEERAAVREHKGRIIGIHNHPTNIYPTGSDFVTAAARGYEFGIIITHDLRVFKYTGPRVMVNPGLLDDVIDKHTKLAYTDNDKRMGFEKAMEELKRRFGITWEEM